MLMFYMSLIDDAEDQAIFEKIYLGYRKQMFFLANSILEHREDAEDAVHEVFLRIATRHMATIRKITDSTDLRNYLLKATKNTCLNHCKKRGNTSVSLDTEEHNYMLGVPELSDQAFLELIYSKIEAERIQAQILALPQPYQEVLYYHFVLELSSSDIAKELGWKVPTVKKQLTRGKRKLLEQLGILGGEPAAHG